MGREKNVYEREHLRALRQGKIVRKKGKGEKLTWMGGSVKPGRKSMKGGPLLPKKMKMIPSRGVQGRGKRARSIPR